LPEGEKKRKKKNEIRKKPQVTPRFSQNQQSLPIAQMTLGPEKSVSTQAARAELHPGTPEPHFVYMISSH